MHVMGQILLGLKCVNTCNSFFEFVKFCICAGYSGMWESRSKVMDIDRDSGIATSASVGHNIVEYTLSKDVTTYTEVSRKSPHTERSFLMMINIE